MNYIVLDLEWNQPAAAVLSRPELKGEIIQFGAVRLDHSFAATGTFEGLVHPVVYRKLNTYVKRITGLDKEQLDRAPGFVAVFDRFLDFCGPEYTLITWGPDDLAILKDNLALHHLPNTLGDHYNLQVIYNAQTGGEKRQVALKEAVAHFEIAQNLTAHDALNDALDTAAVLGRLDMITGLAAYAGQVKTAFRTSPPPLWQEKTRDCTDQKTAAEDGQKLSVVCPICGKPLSVAYHRKSSYLYLGEASCPDHGKMLLRLRIGCKGKRVRPNTPGAIGKKRDFIPGQYHAELALWQEEDAPESVRSKIKRPENSSDPSDPTDQPV